ncbi:MAG: DUF3298 domain-containing protein, partial [Mycobacterium sp.]
MRILVAAVMASGLAGGWLGVCPASAAPPCAELGGTIEAGQLCHVHTATPGYNLDMRFPVDYADQQALTDYLVQNRDGFVTVAKSPGLRDMPYEMDATVEQHRSGPASGGTQSGTPGGTPGATQSVVLKIFQDIGGPQPSTWYKSFTYDSGTKKAVTF